MKLLYIPFLFLVLCGSFEPASVDFPHFRGISKEQSNFLPMGPAPQPIRPFKPGQPYRPAPPSKPSSSGTQTIRYSESARASNMIVPAILLGMPAIVIIALIIRAMRND